MKSIKFKDIYSRSFDGRIVEVVIEATSQFTGEVFEVVGYARCSSKDRFVYEKGETLARFRAIRKALKMMLKQHKAFIVTPYINNPTELYYRQRINELLIVQEDLRNINDGLILLER